MKLQPWNRSLGTSKRSQGVITPGRPKSRRKLKAYARIAEKAQAKMDAAQAAA